MIGRLVGALVGSGPTLLGPGARIATADHPRGRRRPARQTRRRELDDEEESLALVAIAQALRIRRR